MQTHPRRSLQEDTKAIEKDQQRLWCDTIDDGSRREKKFTNVHSSELRERKGPTTGYKRSSVPTKEHASGTRWFHVPYASHSHAKTNERTITTTWRILTDRGSLACNTCFFFPT